MQLNLNSLISEQWSCTRRRRSHSHGPNLCKIFNFLHFIILLYPIYFPTFSSWVMWNRVVPRRFPIFQLPCFPAKVQPWCGIIWGMTWRVIGALCMLPVPFWLVPNGVSYKADGGDDLVCCGHLANAFLYHIYNVVLFHFFFLLVCNKWLRAKAQTFRRPCYKWWILNCDK